MKRAFFALLLTLMIVPASNAATSKRNRKPAKTTEATAESAAKRPIPVTGIMPGKKQLGALDTVGGDLQAGPGTAPSGPIPFAPPVEMTLTRAASKVFDVRSLPQTPPEKLERPEHDEPTINRGTVNGVLAPPGTNPFTPSVPPRNAPAPPTIQNFDGLNFALNGAGHPPDTNGDVGPNHYIQTINTSIGIYQKNGTPIASFTFNTFMSQGAFGNLCDTNNFGDPVVLYDSFEDRWIITDFAFQLSGGNVVNPPGSFQCFAASKTSDPVSGGWNFYSINTANGLGDYPKFGIWPDGLYMTTNMFSYLSGGAFQTARAYAFNKAQMYAGKPTVQVVNFDIPGGDFTVIPSNARLQAGAPPLGTPNYFISSWQFLNALNVYKFHVNWNALATSTFTGPDQPLAATSWPNANVPFANSLGGNTLDVLQIRAMVQNQYSNIGGAESLWLSHTVRRFDVNGLAAPRWYQINVTGGTVADPILQAATWDPDNANVISRFMPSVAVDRAGNMALGYSTSNSTTKPAIKYAGRLSTDPLNTLGQTEQVLIQGTGTQTGTCGGTCTRWGDYSAMTLDPDGCTFWYTNMYYAVDGLNHLTRIGSFAFPSCTPVGAGGTITGTVTVNPGGAPIADATIRLGARTTTTNSSGVYSFLGIPAGAYPTLTAGATGFAAGSASNIVVTDGGTTTQNFSLTATPASACLTDTTQADFQAGALTNTDTTTSPNDVILAKPSLDQFNTNVTNNGAGFNSTTWIAQTFTPSVSGLLVKADLDLFCSGCSGTPQNLTVSVRATSGGLPTGADLASATIPGFLSNAGVYYSVTFGSPASVTAGTTYALVVRPNSNPTGLYAVIRSVINSGTLGVNVYPDGALVASGNSGATWATQTLGGVSYDVGFHTFIDSGFAAAGNLISSVKDAHPAVGQSPTWSTISWTAATPANTSVQFQVAGSNSEGGPFNFVGPDLTPATFFTTSGASISQFNGFRYLEYKAFLATSNSAASPTLNDVAVCLSNVACASPPPTITPTPTPVCGGTSATASGPAAMANYTWSATNGTITGGINSQTVTYTAGATGTVDLMLIVTDGTGCVTSNSISVPITPNPTPAITPTPATVCTNSTGNSASGPAGPTTYAWSIVNGTITSATNGQTITYTAGASGSVGLTLLVTNVGGCQATNTVNVPISANPASPTIIPTPGQVCANSTGNSAAGPAGATTYAWSIVNGTITSATSIQTITYTAGASGTVDLTLVVTNAGGCSATNTINVTINANPATPTITPTPATVCGGSTGNSAAGPAGATTYAWSIVNGTITSATNIQTITYTAGASGTVDLTLVVTNAATCSASNTVNVTINPSPATPTITPTPAQVCANSTGNSAAGPAGATTYAWSIVNGTITSATNIQTITYTAGASGTVGLTLVVTNASGCSATNTVNVTINANPAAPTITPTPAQVCANSTGNSAAGPAGATTYAWSIVNGTITSATNIQTITYTAGASGTVGLTLVVTNASGCSATNTVNVTINPVPATPTISGSPTTFCAGGSVNLTSSSAAGNQWFLNGNPIGGATNQIYNASASGNYTVTVTASGCTSAPSAATVVTVNPNPNATITALASAATGSTGNIASVANAGVGATYVWGITGGTITAGAGTNSITFTAGAPGTLTLNVTVTTSAGCSDAKSANVNVIVPPVTVTSISPTSGTATGGTSVTINGSGFVSGAAVTFGGTAATNVVVVSAIKITARTPAHATGSVNVTVTNTDTSSGTLTSGYLYKTQVFDPNGDNVIDPADIFFLVNYLFTGGQAPHGASGVLSGDANGDGVVDPADIFYIVNYLFLGGQKPNFPSANPAVPGVTALATEAPQISGSITLGKPLLRAGHYVVPVVMSAGRGSIAPQSMSLRVHFDGEGTIGEVAVRKAGAAKDVPAVFETSRRSGNDLSYLVSYDPRGLALGESRSATVAEIELDAADGNVNISIDPLLTMLSDQAGTMKATVANGKLEVSGTTIGSGASPRPRTGREVN